MDQGQLANTLTASVLEQREASKFFLVTGERGVGKTFVGQEFYRRLAARQTRPPFWPEDILASGQRGLELDRHATRPALVEIPPDATPTYAWIGINCQRAIDGMYFDALGAASIQVAKLRSAIEITLRSGRAGRSRTVLLDLLEIAAAFGSLSHDPTASAISAALTTRSAVAAYRELSASRAERHDVSTDQEGVLAIDLGTPDRDTISQYIDLLGALATRLQLPTVLFVDDLQHADPTLLSLLNAIPNAISTNLTVLCTADQEALHAQREAAQEGSERSAGAWLEGGGFDIATRVELGLLDDSALTGIVIDHAPRTSRATIAALVRQSEGNPYRLHLLLDSPRAQPQQGAIMLGPQEISDFPNRIESIYQQAWHFLSPGARRVVAIAAMQGGVVVEDVLHTACRAVGVQAVESHIIEARREQWLLSSDGLLAFPDESHQAVALSEADAVDTLTEADQKSAAECALTLASQALLGPLAPQIARKDFASSRPPRLVLTYLETVSTLASRYWTERHGNVSRPTLTYCGYLAHHGEAHLAAVRLADVGKRLRTAGSMHQGDGFRMELKAAELWSDSGQLDRALRQLDFLEESAPERLLTEPQFSRYFTFVRGRTMGRAGRTSEAVQILRCLAHEPAEDDNWALRSWQVSAELSADAGLVSSGADALIRSYAQLLREDADDATIHWWHDHEHCEKLRVAIEKHGLRQINAARVAVTGPGGFDLQLASKARVTEHAGLWNAALAMQDDILAGLQVAAPNDRSVSVARSDRARLLSYLGRQEESLVEHDRVIEFDEHFSNNRSGGAMLVRANRAQTLSRLGRHDDAREEAAAAYDDLLLTLGPRHPSTLQAKMGMARVVARAGEANEALILHEETTAAFVEVLGSEHPEAQQHVALDNYLKEGLVNVQAIADASRPPSTMRQDEWRLAHYMKTQSEDWQLLFGTAKSTVVLKRMAVDKLLAFAARWL